MNITINVTEDAKHYLAEKGYDDKFGARPLRRAIQKYIEDEVSELILLGELPVGSVLNIELESGSKILSYRVDGKITPVSIVNDE